MKGEFYKMDFRAWNIGTVDLTLEQEAAYLRLCHAMYDVGGPVPNSTRFLQAMFRCGNTKAVTLVKQLIEAGKLAVTADGKLFNHRVAEELRAREAVSSARRAAGERGGSAPRATAERTPSDHRATTERPASDPTASGSKPLENNDADKANASASGSRGEKRRKEVDHSGDKPLHDPHAQGFPPNAFELWYEGFPNKVGKHAAEKAFQRVRLSGKVSYATLVSGLARYRANKPATREWCNPATWLNQGRWADEPAATAQPRASPTARRGSGNGYLDLLRDEFGGHDERHSAPHHDKPRLISGSRH